MRSGRSNDIRSMLGAGGAKRAPEGGGRIDLAGWLVAVRPHLPRPAQRFWPTETTSVFVLLAFSWTTIAGVVLALWSIATFQANPLFLPLTVPIAVIGAVGL